MFLCARVTDLFEKEPIQMGEGKDSLFPPNTKINQKRKKTGW